jgi:hypothetical protein
MNFAQIPDPDTLAPEVRAKLLSMPWFNQVIELHNSGVDVTSELMEKLATRPGAQGYKVTEYELEPGKKSRGLLDVATGEFVSPDKLKGPQFEPQIKSVKDPRTGAESSVLMTSASSAVPYKSDEKPLMQDFYKAAPVFDDKFNVLSHVFTGPDGEVRTVGKGSDLADLIGMMAGGKPATPGAAAPAPAAPAPAQPAPVTREPAFIVKTDADYQRVPSGATYVDPTGKRRTKK